MDLTRTRNGDGDSEIVVAVSFRGSQLALAKDATTIATDSKGRNKRNGRRSRKEDRRSMPPEEECVCVVERPRIKPDVVHWKTKVGGAQRDG